MLLSLFFNLFCKGREIRRNNKQRGIFIILITVGGIGTHRFISSILVIYSQV